MGGDLEIEIIHTGAGPLHPSGWLVRVAGEVSMIAPIDDALRVARRMARTVSRSTGARVGITLTDEDLTVEIGRYGKASSPYRKPQAA